MSINEGLEYLDAYISKKEQDIQKFVEAKEKDIGEKRNYIAENLTIDKVAKRLTSKSTIDAINSIDKSRLKITVKGEEILEDQYIGENKFEYGESIELAYTNYFIELKPNKAFVSVHHASEDLREFIGEKIAKAYVHVAYTLMQKIRQLEDTKKKKKLPEKEEDDLPF